MELIQVGEKTYYIKNPTNIGIYKVNDIDVYLIDSGNDKDAGKKILRIIDEQGWKVVGIINTHSHADHIGGNKYIQDKTGCKIFLNKMEKAFAEYTILEPTLLYGGNILKDMKHKVFVAEIANQIDCIENNLPEGLEYFELPGHYFDMIGIRTSDNVVFLGDCIFSEETIKKYHVCYIFNIGKFIETLDMLKTMQGNLFIPSHCEQMTNMEELIKLNEENIQEICNKILEFCKIPHTFEDILQYIFNEYNLIMTISQNILISNTLKAYLTYLEEHDKLIYEFVDNKMYWKQK